MLFPPEPNVEIGDVWSYNSNNGLVYYKITKIVNREIFGFSLENKNRDIEYIGIINHSNNFYDELNLISRESKKPIHDIYDTLSMLLTGEK